MNEILAMLFPLVGVTAVGLVALFVVKPWKKKNRRPTIFEVTNAEVEQLYGHGKETSGVLVNNGNLQGALREVRIAIKRAEEAAHLAGERLTKTIVP